MGFTVEPVSRSRNSDRRRELRSPLTGELSILCEDEQGRKSFSRVKLLDVSAHGARFQTPSRLNLRSSVSFDHPKFGVGGQGTVRYCTSSRKGPGYEIGVEFPQGTGWRGPLPTEDPRLLGAATSHPDAPSPHYKM